MNIPSDEGERGVRVWELVLIAVVVAVSVLLLATSRGRTRDLANRTKCVSNLKQVGIAVISYMTSPLGPDGRKGYLPHVRARDAPDGPGDVGRTWEMLVWTGGIDDPECFVCPGAGDVPRRRPEDEALAAFRFEDSDVQTTREFSYGWTKDQRTDGNSRSSMIVAADRTAGPGSRNHADGRSLLRFDGSVDFLPIEVELGPVVEDDPDVAAALSGLNLAP